VRTSYRIRLDSWHLVSNVCALQRPLRCVGHSSLSLGKLIKSFVEIILASDELVKGAVMFGTGQSQNGVLIEPAKPLDPGDRVAVKALLDAIWSVKFLIIYKLRNG
jgi:hypothetical protein